MVHGVFVYVCMIQNYLNSGSICYHKNIDDQGIELFLIRTENIFRHFLICLEIDMDLINFSHNLFSIFLRNYLIIRTPFALSYSLKYKFSSFSIYTIPILQAGERRLLSGRFADTDNDIYNDAGCQYT